MGEFSETQMLVGSWVTLVLSLSVFSIFGALFVKSAKFLHSLRNVPSPPALPLIGNSIQLNCSLVEFFRKLIYWSKQFGDIYLIWLGPRPLLFLYRMEGVQALLSSRIHIDKSLEYDYLEKWLGRGLVTNKGDSWHFRRKLITPSFHSCVLQDYLKSTIQMAKTLVDCLANEVDNEGFDIVPYTKRAALDVICETTMGYHMNAQTRLNNDYVRAVERMSEIVQTRFTNIWISADTIFNMTELGRDQRHALDVIHKNIDKIIAERKAKWEASKNDDSNESIKKRPAFMDLLLEVSQNGTILSDTDIRDEVNTFMFAGHDTVATSLAWFFYLLGHHPDYQQKILDEYDEIVGNKDLTLELLNKLTWLDACIKEVWRIYPTVPLIARQIYHPIKIMNHDVPIGSTVLINTYLLHRDPRHFEDAETFRPERFMPDSPKLPTFAFLPFSAGSRNCIGWKFATMEVKVMILSVLRAYEVSSVEAREDLKLFAAIVLVSESGLRVKIKPRKRDHLD